MQTKTIVQASANVIRVTRLTKGNIYKRFDSNDYVYYGIVTDVLNDGTNTIIMSTEYRKSWYSIDVAQKIIRGNDDIVLFPATLADLEMDFGEIIKKKEQEIIDCNKKIEEHSKTIDTLNKMLTGEMQKELTAPEFREMTQGEFNAKLEQIG